MNHCPFCGSACNKGALLCPFCKVELPEDGLINYYRIILERDRSYFEDAKRKKLDALARKEQLVRESAIAAAKAESEAEDSRIAKEAAAERKKKADEALIRQQEFNEKTSRLFKKFGPTAGVVTALALIINFVAIPMIEQRRLDEKFQGSTLAACEYARQVDTSIKAHYKKLYEVLANGNSFGSYWDKENERITTLHIEKIRGSFVNPSSSQELVSPEVNEYENAIAFDLSRLRTAFSTYWDKTDLDYYGEGTILGQNKQFIAWCDDRDQ